MPHSKTKKTKKVTKAVKKAAAPRVESHEEEIEAEDVAIIPKKAVKPLEVEEEEAIPVVIDKPEEVVGTFGEVPTEEDAEDDAELDEEEINPFGDKWEV